MEGSERGKKRIKKNPMKCPKCQFDNPDNTRYCGNCGSPFPSAIHISSSPTETFEPQEEELAIGSTFAGRYQIIEELGRGGMGRVYKVLDAEVQETIALKILRSEIASNKKTIQRFRNELKLARKISHKNVCRMYDLNKEDEIYFITMEYVSGENLKSMIQMMGHLSAGKTILIAKQICEGLTEAHKLDVVHRDLKPSNIMIDKEGNAHIMDFGIARSIDLEDVTRTEARVGTPKYMSPEQMTGEEIDPRSDIYSFGVILYEMVTGSIPYEGDTAAEIAVKQNTEIPQEPRKINPQIPQNFNQLILKCIKQDKNKRFENSNALLEELLEIAQEVPTTDRIYPRKKTEIAFLKKPFPTLKAIGILVFVAAILIVGIILIEKNFRKEKFEMLPERKTSWTNAIAVLPFEDMSLQRDQEHFCDAMTEAIITKLTSIEELRVVPYQSISRYKGTKKTLGEISKELGVLTILVPKLKKEGDLIRVSAQLIDSNEDTIIEAFTYEEELNSVFEVEDRISKSIADALEVRLGEDTLEAIKKREPSDIRAYEFYAKGTYLEKRYRRFEKKGDMEEAKRNFQKAIEIAPNYALAYWGLGYAHEALFVREEKKDDLDLALKNFNRAYELDPNLPEANIGLVWAYFYKENLEKAIYFCKRAVNLAPNNPEIHFNVGSYMRSIGLFRKAIESYSKAIEINPVDLHYRWLCASCYSYLGEYEEAIGLIKEGLELEPDDIGLRLYYARQLIWMERYDEAEFEIAKVEIEDPDEPNILYTRALIFAAKGEREKALAVVEGIDPYYYSYLVSSVYSILEMKDEAIENIEDAIERGFHEIQTYMYSYPFLTNHRLFDNLRDEPRFQRIVQQEKKKYEEKIRVNDGVQPTK
jgi:serine/threonine protein kinase/Tfp pilus assembly protein PilF